MRVSPDTISPATLTLFTELLCGKPAVKESQVLPNPMIGRHELVDIDSYLEPEDPFGSKVDLPVDAQQPTIRHSLKTPYYECGDDEHLGIDAQRKEVLIAVANGFLNGCGVTRTGVTMYPEMMDDVSRANANFAKARVQAAKSCIWFCIVDQ